MEDTCDYHLWLSRTEEDYGHYEKWKHIYVYFLGYGSILPIFIDFHT